MRESSSVEFCSSVKDFLSSEDLDWCILVSFNFILDKVDLIGIIVIDNDSIKMAWESLSTWVYLRYFKTWEEGCTVVGLGFVLGNE